MTVLALLIKRALRMIGQLGPGRGAGPSEIADALVVLNAMLDSWNTERLTVYQILRTLYALTAGQNDYTLGPTGTLVGLRPTRIEGAAILSSGSTDEQAIDVLTLERYRANQYGLYSDQAYPNTNLVLRPDPVAGDQLVLYTWAQLSAFAADSDVVSLPPGYADAIAYNLAVRLASEWSRVLRPDVVQLARESKAKIKSLNMPVLELTCDTALLSNFTFDIRTNR